MTDNIVKQTNPRIKALFEITPKFKNMQELAPYFNRLQQLDPTIEKIKPEKLNFKILFEIAEKIRRRQKTEISFLTKSHPEKKELSYWSKNNLKKAVMTNFLDILVYSTIQNKESLERILTRLEGKDKLINPGLSGDHLSSQPH